MFRPKLAGLMLVALLVGGCARTAAPLPQAPRPTPTPAISVSLPRDAAPHDALTEWWYYTGHLRDSAGRQYGFEFTIFQVERQGAPTGYLAHFAVSDVGGGRFSHEARYVTQTAAAPAWPLTVGGWSLSASDVIDATMDSGRWALHLALSDEKAPVLHNGGYFDFGAAGGSYYYSRTRLAVSGTLNGDPVTGTAWMDHQWGNFLVTQDLVWDWYSLQLDDRTELMAYVLRNSGIVFGTYVHADGTSQELSAAQVQVEATGSWTSPHTGGTYPSGWRVSLPDGRRLDVRPQLADQELYFPGPGPGDGQGGMAYWEGAVSVGGDASGQGYIELTGYAPQP